MRTSAWSNQYGVREFILKVYPRNVREISERSLRSSALRSILNPGLSSNTYQFRFRISLSRKTIDQSTYWFNTVLILFHTSSLLNRMLSDKATCLPIYPPTSTALPTGSCAFSPHLVWSDLRASSAPEKPTRTIKRLENNSFHTEPNEAGHWSTPLFDRT